MTDNRLLLLLLILTLCAVNGWHNNRFGSGNNFLRKVDKFLERQDLLRQMAMENDDMEIDIVPSGRKERKKSDDKGIFGGLKKLFKQDDKSKEKRARQELVNQNVDKLFKETGLSSTVMGGMLGMLAKGAVGLIAESMVQSAGNYYPY